MGIIQTLYLVRAEFASIIGTLGFFLAFSAYTMSARGEPEGYCVAPSKTIKAVFGYLIIQFCFILSSVILKLNLEMLYRHLKNDSSTTPPAASPPATLSDAPPGTLSDVPPGNLASLDILLSRIIKAVVVFTVVLDFFALLLFTAMCAAVLQLRQVAFLCLGFISFPPFIFVLAVNLLLFISIVMLATLIFVTVFPPVPLISEI